MPALAVVVAELEEALADDGPHDRAALGLGCR